MSLKHPSKCPRCRVLQHDGYSEKTQKDLCKYCGDNAGNYDPACKSFLELEPEDIYIDLFEPTMPLNGHWNPERIKKITERK